MICHRRWMPIYSFASYHSKTQVNGNVLHYTRTYEIKELSVPLEKVDDLKTLYRIIASDGRNNAVLTVRHSRVLTFSFYCRAKSGPTRRTPRDPSEKPRSTTRKPIGRG
jgi:hypothetical protein